MLEAEALRKNNAALASEAFAASVVPQDRPLDGVDAFPTAAAVRRAVLHRSLYPLTAPPSKAPPPMSTAELDAEQRAAAAAKGQLIVSGAAPGAAPASRGALIVAESALGSGRSATTAAASTGVTGGTGGLRPGVSSEYQKRARDIATARGDLENVRSGSSSDAIIAMDAEVLRNKTRARQEAIGEREKQHAKWKLQRVIAGHTGAVLSVAVDPGNAWFASGSDDSTIRIYNLATGKLRVQPLTGHSAAVRALHISNRSPYMFSGSDDNSVKVWDLETNRVIGSFFGHKGAVTAIAGHPDLDVVATACADKMVRIWDVRTRSAVFELRGHEKQVFSVAMQSAEPQIVSGGEDAFVYIWDLKAGKALTRLTRHKKAVHSVTLHHTEATMVTIGDDNVRKWRLPAGEFYTNMTSSAMPSAPLEATWRTSCVNADNVLFVGARNGQMRFYDWGSHKLYQFAETRSVKGTLAGEHGIRCSVFDVSGTKLLTGEGDKTVKMWHQPDGSGH